MDEQAILQQVIELLKQGVSEQELVNMGVPEAIIQQAIMLVQQDAAGQQMQQPQPETMSGFAGMQPSGQGMY